MVRKKSPEEVKKSKGKLSGEKSRPATYPSAVRMARLVDEMPRHGLGRRLSSVAKTAT